MILERNLRFYYMIRSKMARIREKELIYGRTYSGLIRGKQSYNTISYLIPQLQFH